MRYRSIGNALQIKRTMLLRAEYYERAFPQLGSVATWCDELRGMIGSGESQRQEIRKAIGDLADDRERRVLYARCIQGDSWERVAIENEISTATARRIYARGAQRIEQNCL